MAAVVATVFAAGFRLAHASEPIPLPGYAIDASGMLPVPTIAINVNAIQSGLFTGANVILIALGTVVFLLIGFAFGGKILRMIADFIMRFSF